MATVENILNLDIPRPTLVLRPGKGAPISSDFVFDRGSRAQNLRPAEGRYETLPSGEPRIWGVEQGLMLESYGVENRVLHSIDQSPSNTSFDNTGTTNSSVSSLFKDGTAWKYTHDGSAGWISWRPSIGNTTADKMTASAIIEDVDQDTSVVQLIDDGASDTFADIYYDWGSGIVDAKSAGYTYARKLADIGPNGGVVYRLIATGKPPASGNPLRAACLLGGNGAGGTTGIIHHFQAEPNDKASAPIKTAGSNVTRLGEDLTAPVSSDWFSRDHGTFVIEFYPNHHHENRFPWLLKGDNTNDRLYYSGFANSGAPPFSLTFYDNSAGTGITDIRDSFSPYKKHRAIVTFNKQQVRIGLDGQVNTTSYDGRLLEETSKFVFGAHNHQSNTVYTAINYRPAFLSQTAVETLSAV